MTEQTTPITEIPAFQALREYQEGLRKMPEKIECSIADGCMHTKSGKCDGYKVLHHSHLARAHYGCNTVKVFGFGRKA